MIQLQVLNKILAEKDSSMITLNNLTGEYFSDYQEEFYYIKNHLDRFGNICDLETFLSHFKNFEVISVSEPDSYLLGELVKDKNKRFLAENYNKIRTLIMNNNVEEAMSVLRQASEESGSSVSLQCVNILEDTEARLAAYEDRCSNPDKYFVKTGFTELDEIIGGWDTNEDLVTIAARNGLGKSWILFKCAAAAAKQGKRVGIYSGEMSEETVGYRIDTLLGHVSNGALVHGSPSIKNEYKSFLEELKNIPGELFVLTPKMINGSAGVAALRAFVEKYKLDVLFVDQHSLLADDRKAKNPTEKAANVSTDLKLLQTIKRIPVVCVCQQNREKLDEGKSFDTTQLAQSDKIGQDSSIILFIERKDDLLKLHLIKSRNSGAGNVLTYRVDLNRGYFQYIPEEQKEGQSEKPYQPAPSGYSEDEVF